MTDHETVSLREFIDEKFRNTHEKLDCLDEKVGQLESATTDRLKLVEFRAEQQAKRLSLMSSRVSLLWRGTGGIIIAVGALIWAKIKIYL